ncbi:MAG: TetR family transcriptional regulator [Hyphomonadaceae bacterium]|nr:TetR family transcriptional regulator [Hyphomonadaceae bacterium]
MNAMRPDSATRRAIFQAAQRVFAECGYHGATVGRIAARAGCTPSLINYHFIGKERLYAEVLAQAGAWSAAWIDEPWPADRCALAGLLAERMTRAGDDARRLLAWEALRPSQDGARLLEETRRDAILRLTARLDALGHSAPGACAHALAALAETATPAMDRAALSAVLAWLLRAADAA